MSENIILDVRNLQKGYKKFPILKDVSFQIKQGHILGLIWKERSRENNSDEVKQVSEGEEAIYSATEMIRMERENKKCIMIEKSLVLRQISGILCLLNSYSKFALSMLKLRLFIGKIMSIITV